MQSVEISQGGRRLRPVRTEVKHLKEAAVTFDDSGDAAGEGEAAAATGEGDWLFTGFVGKNWNGEVGLVI